MRIHTWAIGLFLILGIGLFTAILFLIGNRHDVFGEHVEFYAEFSDIGGLPRWRAGAEFPASRPARSRALKFRPAQRRSSG